MAKHAIILVMTLTILVILTGMGPSLSGPTVEIADRSGKSTQVDGLTYNHAPYIEGKLGPADIRIELQKVRRIEVEGDEMVIHTSSETLRIYHNNGTFAGKTGFGSYKISVREVGHITSVR